MIDIKGEIDRNTIIVGDFDTLLTSMVRTSMQKTNKTAALNNTLDQMDLIGIFRVFTPKAAEYIYIFSSAHGMFSRIDHMLGLKSQ